MAAPMLGCSRSWRAPRSGSTARATTLRQLLPLLHAYSSPMANGPPLQMSPSSSQPSSIAVLRLDNPPVNALSHAERRRLLAELTRAEEDPTISAIVLTGTAEFFSAGADIREFGTPAAAAAPNLHTLIKRFEYC